MSRRRARPRGREDRRPARADSASLPHASGPSPTLWRAGLILTAGIIVYAGSLSAPFIFDDIPSIAENVDLRAWPDLGRVLRSAQAESPLAGRPLVTLTFALNHAFGGLDVTGYRVVNLGLHLACALLLFGLARRTVAGLGSPGFAGHADGVATAVALIWTVHPINSEVVSYLTQRTESLMAFFAFATLYAAVRARDSARRGRWETVAVASCALGMACKESMVTVPVLVVLYDRVFLFGSLSDAVRARRRLYAGLAASWVVLATLMWSTPRTSGAGFASTHVSAWSYLLNQTVMITRYVWLTLWPESLVLYYGWNTPATLGQVLPQAVFVTALAVLTVWSLARWPRLGFLGAWCFITLSPASSFVTVASEVGAERRMYLPVIGLIALAVVAAVRVLHDRADHNVARRAAGRPSLAAAVLLTVAVVALGARTMARTDEYASALTMARTVYARWPTPAAAHMLGTELAKAGQRDEALRFLRIAADAFPPAKLDLGVQLFEAGQYDAAVHELRAFVREEPRLEFTRRAARLAGEALGKAGRWPEAIEAYRRILAAAPGDTDTAGLLADALFQTGAFDDAIAAYRQFLTASPRHADALANLAIAYVATDRLDEAIAAFRQVADVQPDNREAAHNLTRALLDRGRQEDVAEAGDRARAAVARAPRDPIAHELLGRSLEQSGRRAEARTAYERALAIDPTLPGALDGLRRVGG